MKDLYHDLLPVVSINSIVGNNDTEGKGVGVDLQGYEGALVVFNIGQSGDTLSGSVYITLKIQHCDTDTDGSYEDVAAGDYQGSNQGLVIDAAAEDEVVKAIGYTGGKRWVRAIVDFTGTHTNGIPIGATVIKGKPRHAPVA